MSPWTQPPALVVGEVVRILPDGPQYRVTRVGSGSATLKPRAAAPVLVELPDGRSFYAYEGGATLNVSVHSFVIREVARG